MQHANLLQDLLNGRSLTGILHMLNKTPINWFSKLQATVKTTTSGSKYTAKIHMKKMFLKYKDNNCTTKY